MRYGRQGSTVGLDRLHAFHVCRDARSNLSVRIGCYALGDRAYNHHGLHQTDSPYLSIKEVGGARDRKVQLRSRAIRSAVKSIDRLFTEERSRSDR